MEIISLHSADFNANVKRHMYGLSGHKGLLSGR